MTSTDGKVETLPRAKLDVTEADSSGSGGATAAHVVADDVEAARIQAVRRYDILDTPPDGAYDRITDLAARLFNVPISIVSIVDTDRIWFKSHHGLDTEEVPRDPGLCASATLADDTYIVENALTDPRTLANPLVTGALGLRFYAAHPLITQDGHRLGTLCIIDRQPRELTEQEATTLQTLAVIVMDSLQLRLSALRVLRLEAEERAALATQVEHNQAVAEQLRQGLESNRQIGKALGLLMAMYHLDEQAAFEKLRGHSRDLNIKLRQIAEEMVTHHNQGYPSVPPAGGKRESPAP